MIDAEIKVHCTDNGKDFPMHVLSYKSKVFLEVAFQTLKIKLSYQDRNKVYVGSLAGREFVVREDSLPATK